jgi:diaminopimelate decarboxylase
VNFIGRRANPARGRWPYASKCGPVCGPTAGASSDAFATGREMDSVGEGDLVVIRTAGTYGATMSSSHNTRPLTPKVLLDGHRSSLVRQRLGNCKSGLSAAAGLVVKIGGGGLPLK